MASHSDELIETALWLLTRREGQRGRLSSARVRRSISTTYYSLFHFILEEATKKVVGTGSTRRIQRRALTRAVSHTGLKLALDRVAGARVHDAVAGLFGDPSTPATVPKFAREMASAFVDAQTKRHDADYDLNAVFSEADARLQRSRALRAVRRWKRSRTEEDQAFKRALLLLVILNGRIKPDR